MKSAYIHIPFCKSICSYCDFCKNFHDEATVNDYLKSLKKEIKNIYNNEWLETLYIGGGTPSCLFANEMNAFLDIMDLFNLKEDYEFTFECNFEDITEELLVLLKEKRVNRLSIGIESFNEEFSDVLERKINRALMMEKINLSKKYFNNINLDLMYALPDESILQLEKDLESFSKINVKHISIYALILEEHTKLKIKDIKETSDDIQFEMYMKIVAFLKKYGYDHYEISNFSKPGYESKHNLVYWNNDEYYGFGAGASGFINETRYDNTKSVKKYLSGKYRVNEEVLSPSQRMKDEVMLGLRKTTGINKKNFKDKYGINFSDVFDTSFLIKNKFLMENDECLFIKEEDLFISSEIIMRLIYLE